MDSDWIEFVGRQDPGKVPAPAPSLAPQQRVRRLWPRELALTAAALAVVLALRLASEHFGLLRPGLPRHDVHAAAQVRDLRYALDLYVRENGRYPERLEDLVEDRWVGPDQTSLAGYQIAYHAAPDGRRYRLDIARDR